MERFVKVVNGLKILIILTKCSILDVWQCSEYATNSLEVKMQMIPLGVLYEIVLVKL